jgi:hypothetical protein
MTYILKNNRKFIIKLLTIVFLAMPIGYCKEKSDKLLPVENSVEESSLVKEAKEEAVKEKFHFGQVIKDKEQLQLFIGSTINAMEINSQSDLKSMLEKTTKGFFFHNLMINSEVFLRFTFKLIKTPKAIASFLGIFLEKNKIILFSLAMVLSLILAHYLGEVKFYFKALSPWRVLYGLTRFTGVNAFRIWVFVFLFSANLKPIGGILLSSIH